MTLDKLLAFRGKTADHIIEASVTSRNRRFCIEAVRSFVVSKQDGQVPAARQCVQCERTSLAGNIVFVQIEDLSRTGRGRPVVTLDRDRHQKPA